MPFAKTATPQQRFLNKVMPVVDGCWLWAGGIKPNGYGNFYLEGRTVEAHRFSYEISRGPIPAGLQIDHLCRKTMCVNPAHLEPVTPKENIRRGTRVNSKKTECQNGHPYNDKNTYVWRTQRHCRPCRANREAARRSKEAT